MRRRISKKTRRVSNKLKQRMNQPTISWKDFFKVKKVSKSKTTKKKKSKAKTDVDKHAESNIEKFQGHLITDVPLGDSYHRGSVASQKHFYKRYNRVENFIRFFTKVMKKMPKKRLHIVKSPVIKEWTKDFDIDRLQIDMSDINSIKQRKSKLNTKEVFDPFVIGLGDQFYGLTKQIKKAMKENYRYICLYLTVLLTNNRGGHANIILYDTKNKVIELFEPHGGLDKLSVINQHYKDISYIIKKHSEYMFPKYKFISPSGYIPFILQQNIDNFTGSCLSICMMYLHYKLLNPNIPSKVIVNRIKHNGKNFLNRYMKYIENTIKNKQTKHKSKSIKTF